MHDKPHKKETKEKISILVRELWKNPNYKKHMSDVHKGKSSGRKGKNNSIEHRRKISESNKGRKLTEEHKNKISKGNKGRIGFWTGKHFPIEIRKKISETHKRIGHRPPCLKGKNSPSWKGGISRLKAYKHYNNFEYKEWRRQVFERDNYTCQKCGVRGVAIHPHHIKSYTYYPELRYDVNNGKVLCIPCHHQTHFGH